MNTRHDRNDRSATKDGAIGAEFQPPELTGGTGLDAALRCQGVSAWQAALMAGTTEVDAAFFRGKAHGIEQARGSVEMKRQIDAVAIRRMDRLCTALCTVALDKKVEDFLPYGLLEEVKAWLGGKPVPPEASWLR